MDSSENITGWCVHTMILYVNLFCVESENVSAHIIMNEAHGDLFELFKHNQFSDSNPSVFVFKPQHKAQAQHRCLLYPHNKSLI